MFDWWRRLMFGRYGGDQLNNALFVLCMILLGIHWLTRWSVFMLLGLVLLLLCYFRMFSRNISARYAENQRFLAFWQPLRMKLHNKTAQFRDRKYHKYLKCPSCKTTLRVPRRKGKIQITCPKCRHQFMTKS